MVKHISQLSNYEEAELKGTDKSGC